MSGERPQSRWRWNIGKLLILIQIKVELALFGPEFLINQVCEIFIFLLETFFCFSIANFVGDFGDIVRRLRLLDAQIVNTFVPYFPQSWLGVLSKPFARPVVLPYRPLSIKRVRLIKSKWETMRSKMVFPSISLVKRDLSPCTSYCCHSAHAKREGSPSAGRRIRHYSRRFHQ